MKLKRAEVIKYFLKVAERELEAELPEEAEEFSFIQLIADIIFRRLRHIMYGMRHKI